MNSKLTAAALLGLIPLWLLSAFLHVVDPDVGGIAGLAQPHILASTLLITLMLSVPALAIIYSYAGARRRGYAASLLLIAGLIGLSLALMASSATTPGGWLLSFGSLALICALVFGISTLPAVLALHHRNEPAL